MSKKLYHLCDILCLLACSGILMIMYHSNDHLRNLPSFVESLEQIIKTVYVLTAMTLGLFILTVISLVGAVKNSTRILTMLSILLVVVFFGEVALTGYIYYKRDDNEQFALEQMISRISNPNTSFWDDLHNDFQCCGINGPQDWIPYKTIPASCCATTEKVCTEYDAYVGGCFEPLKYMLEQYRFVISCCLVGSGFVQLMVVLVAWIRKMSEKSREQCTVSMEI